MLFRSVADSTIKVDEKDLRDYYNSNKEDFKQEASRKIEYVVFEVAPSQADREASAKSIETLKQSFMSTTDDSAFVAANSDSRTPIGYYKKGGLSPAIDTVFFGGGAPAGTIVGPYEENGSLRLAKNLGSKTMSDSIKVSHALVSFVGAERAAATVTRTKEQAKAMADSLLAVIKKDPKQFEEIAKNKSDDAVASTKAGDLDWITRSSPDRKSTRLNSSH